MNVDLSRQPEIMNGPTSNFVYLEDKGDFMTIAHPLWQKLHDVASGKLERDKMARMMGLSLMDSSSKAPGGTYQAGFEYRAEPSKALPPGMLVRRLDGGRYARFLLKGPYAHLAVAYPLAMQRVAEAGLKMRHAFFMEAYLNTPEEVPEAELLTEILIPIQ